MPKAAATSVCKQSYGSIYSPCLIRWDMGGNMQEIIVLHSFGIFRSLRAHDHACPVKLTTPIMTGLRYEVVNVTGQWEGLIMI